MTVSNTLQVKRNDRLRQALEARYERANRITASKHDLGVRILRGNGDIPPGMEEVPGWTDGKTVYLNNRVLDIENLNDLGLIAALGVNLHELAHVMFTPSLKGSLAQRVNNEGRVAWHSFNVLEDQRAETFFGTKFSDAKKFYTSMVFRYLLQHEKQWDTNYVLVYGRRYLPWNLVKELGQRFIRPDLIENFEDVINGYRTLDVHRQPDVAYQHIMEFRRLLILLNEEAGQETVPMSGHGNDDKTAKSTPEYSESQRPPAKEVRELAEKAEEEDFADSVSETLEEPEEDDTEDETEGGAGGDTETEPEEGEDDGEPGSEAADGDVEGELEDGEGDEDDDEPETGCTDDGPMESSEGAEGDGEDADGPDGDGGSGETGAADDEDADEGDDGSEGGAPSAGMSGGADLEEPEPMSNRELLDFLEEGLEEVASSDDVRAEVERTRNAARSLANGTWKPQLPRLHSNGRHTTLDAPLTLEGMGHIKALTKRFRDARVSAETVLKRDQRHGTLNPLAHAKAQPGDLDIFDEWDAGLSGEDAEMDVAVLLDISGSMGRSMNNIIDDASFAVYAIKRALEDAGDTHVTVWAYDNEGFLLYDRNQRVSMSSYEVPTTPGGTNPEPALRDALSVLGTTKSKLRLLIVVTDGNWTHATQGSCEELIERANGAGVVTVLVGFANAVSMYGRHECSIAKDLRRPADLADLASDIATRMVREAEQNAKRGG